MGRLDPTAVVSKDPEESMTTANLAVSAIAIAFWIYCLVDFSRTDEVDMRLFNRVTWIVLLVLGNVLGGLLWIFLGRPER